MASVGSIFPTNAVGSLTAVKRDGNGSISLKKPGSPGRGEERSAGAYAPALPASVSRSAFSAMRFTAG